MKKFQSEEILIIFRFEILSEKKIHLNTSAILSFLELSMTISFNYPLIFNRI
jgi:hypothetical protein